MLLMLLLRHGDLDQRHSDHRVGSTVEDHERVDTDGTPAFDEHDVRRQSEERRLAGLPRERRRQDRLVASRNDLGRVLAVENRPADVVLQIVAGLGARVAAPGRVVEEQIVAVAEHDGIRSSLDQSRIERVIALEAIKQSINQSSTRSERECRARCARVGGGYVEHTTGIQTPGTCW